MINERSASKIENLKLWDVVSYEGFQYAVMSFQSRSDVTITNNPQFSYVSVETKTEHVVENGILVEKRWKETTDRTRNDVSRAAAQYLVFSVRRHPSVDFWPAYTTVSAQRMNDDGTPNFKGEIITFHDEHLSGYTPVSSVFVHRNLAD